MLQYRYYSSLLCGYIKLITYLLTTCRGKYFSNILYKKKVVLKPQPHLYLKHCLYTAAKILSIKTISRNQAQYASSSFHSKVRRFTARWRNNIK